MQVSQYETTAEPLTFVSHFYEKADMDETGTLPEYFPVPLPFQLGSKHYHVSYIRIKNKKYIFGIGKIDKK